MNNEPGLFAETSKLKFKAFLRTGVTVRHKAGKTTRKKHYWTVLLGLNGENVFTGETKFNKKESIDMLKSWFPGVQIVVEDRASRHIDETE